MGIGKKIAAVLRPGVGEQRLLIGEVENSDLEPFTVISRQAYLYGQWETVKTAMIPGDLQSQDNAVLHDMVGWKGKF